MDRTEHAEHTEGVLSEGTVREWSDDHGWGVIDSADTPGGCWVLFSMIVSAGFRSLRPGDHVTFTYEAPGQDGFNYRAVLVWPPGVRPGTPQRPAREGPSAAYRSSLTIRWPDGSVTKGVPGRGQGEDPRPTVQLAELYVPSFAPMLSNAASRGCSFTQASARGRSSLSASADS